MKYTLIGRAVIPMIMASIAFAAVAASCAPDSDIPAGSGTGTASGNATSSSSGNTSSGNTSSSSSGDVFGDGGIEMDAAPDPDAACGLITEEAVAAPLNLYIAFDKSQSMTTGNKWGSAKQGLSGFLNDPKSAGISVALNFFPLPNESTCDQFAYKDPVVPFGELPAHAAEVELALNNQNPDGFSTPIYPALGGAILKGIEVAQQNPGETSAILLITDGQPVGPAPMCGNVNPEDPQAIADLAATGLNFKPSVRTFVIGLPGVDQVFANLVAAAGGTGQGIFVGAANVQTEFQNALSKVRGQALPCEYEIPAKVSGGEVDPGFVNVLLSLNGMPDVVLAQDASCAGEGWKYDNAANPKRIIFCDASCQAIKKSASAKVQILLGCKTQVVN